MPLYPFQEQVYDLLTAGKSVILQAPTGAGKTRAALYPFLKSWEYGEDFPRKCIYAVPMRVLATQFWEEYHGLVKEYRFQRPPRVTIQTGEHRDDEKLEGDLIFATIDQVLSSYLMAPYSLPRRLSNLNAGAIAGSYMVFDEFHLFDPTSTLPTTLEMLKALRGFAPFLLMTATFSEDMLSGLAQQLGAVVVPGSAVARKQMQSIPSQEKTRIYRVSEEPLSAEAIVRCHRQRTLVVCNVVDRARRLYEDLRQRSDSISTEVILLHSRFLPQDRKRIESQVRNQFSQGNNEGRKIVVATQVVEVGLNITCGTLHTELAPANAILQRAGRCARYRGETGTVYVYAQGIDSSGDVVELAETAWPYQEQRPIIQRTLTSLNECQGRSLTFSDEQAIISQAHGENDRLSIEGLEATQTSHRGRMYRVMDGDRNADAGSLIRAVTSQLVVIHDKPDDLLNAPFRAEAFSLHPGTVAKYVRQWEKAGVLRPGDVQILTDSGDAGESGASAYKWVSVPDRRALFATPLVLIHPQLAGYTEEVGLILGQDTGFRSRPSAGKVGWRGSSYTYALETYADHIRAVYTAFLTEVWPHLAGPAARISQVLGWPAELLERAAHLCVLFHDVGKLRQRWQDWAAAYQAGIGHPGLEGEAYAHTDYDRGNPVHREQQRVCGRRPPHAVEGAAAAAPLLIAPLAGKEPLVRAAFTAIARHHGAFTRRGECYSLIPSATDKLSTTLTWLPEDLVRDITVDALWTSQTPTQDRVAGLLARPARPDEWLSYIILARALRLSDQAGTSSVTT